MLTDNWKDLAGKAQSTFQNSLKQAIDLADFDDELAKKYRILPSAIGANCEDFGSPAEYPLEEYLKNITPKSVGHYRKRPSGIIEGSQM